MVIFVNVIFSSKKNRVITVLERNEKSETNKRRREKRRFASLLFASLAIHYTPTFRHMPHHLPHLFHARWSQTKQRRNTLFFLFVSLSKNCSFLVYIFCFLLVFFFNALHCNTSRHLRSSLFLCLVFLRSSLSILASISSFPPTTTPPILLACPDPDSIILVFDVCRNISNSRIFE